MRQLEVQAENTMTTMDELLFKNRLMMVLMAAVPPILCFGIIPLNTIKNRINYQVGFVVSGMHRLSKPIKPGRALPLRLALIEVERVLCDILEEESKKNTKSYRTMISQHKGMLQYQLFRFTEILNQSVINLRRQVFEPYSNITDAEAQACVFSVSGIGTVINTEYDSIRRDILDLTRSSHSAARKMTLVKQMRSSYQCLKD